MMDIHLVVTTEGDRRGRERETAGSAGSVPRYLNEPSVMKRDITDPKDGSSKSRRFRSACAQRHLHLPEDDPASEPQRRTPLLPKADRKATGGGHRKVRPDAVATGRRASCS